MTEQLSIAELVEQIVIGPILDRAAAEALAVGSAPARRLLDLSSLLETVRAFAISNDERSPAEADLATPWKIGDVHGVFQLQRLLGSGGMGEVWLATRCDGLVEQQVAIKRVRGMRQQWVRRLLREREILARLAHPNIARFLDAGFDATGAPYMVLEYVSGETVEHWCERQQPSLRQRIELLCAICDAVAYAHSHLIVHLDIKPANVLVDLANTPRLLDFGVARLLNVATGDPTQTGLLALTLANAAPEQLLGGELSTLTDVYALGLLGFRILVGDLPQLRRDPSLARLANGLARDEPEAASAALRARDPNAEDGIAWRELSGDIDAIIALSLRPEPKQRYGSAAALAADLRRWADGLPVEARGSSRGYQLRRLAWRHRGWITAAVIAGAGLVLGTAIALQQAQRARAAAHTALVVQKFLEEIFTSADPWRGQPGRTVTALDLAERGMQRIEIDLALQPRAQAELYMKLGRVFSVAGDVRQSVVAYGRAASLFQGMPDATLAEHVDSAKFHALAQFYAGDYDAAERGIEAVFATIPALDLERGGLTLELYGVLHDVARSRADYPRTRRFSDQCFQAALTHADPMRMTANLHYYRSMDELHAGDLRAANQHALHALNFRRARSDESVQWRSTIVERSMQVLLALGPSEGDVVRAERQTALRAKIFGVQSDYYAQALKTLAVAYLDGGRHAEARSAIERATELWAEPGQPAMPSLDMAEARYLAGLIALAQARPADAVQVLTLAREFYVAVGGEQAAPSLAADAALAYATGAEDRAAARANLQRVFALQTQRNDLESARTALWLASLAAADGDASAAAAAAHGGLAVLARQGRPSHRLRPELLKFLDEPARAAASAFEGVDLEPLRVAIDAVFARVEADFRLSQAAQ